MDTIPKTYRQTGQYKSTARKYGQFVRQPHGGTLKTGARKKDKQLSDVCFSIVPNLFGGNKSGVNLSLWLGLHESQFNKFGVTYTQMNRLVKNLYRNVMATTQKDLIGDPRVGLRGDKGLAPKGGTGFLRLSMRTSISTQYNKNHGLPAVMNIEVPVKYGHYVNSAKLTLAHSENKLINNKPNKRARRVIGYKGGKAIMGYRNLHDPEAKSGFFEEILKTAQKNAAIQFRILLNGWNINPKNATEYFDLAPKEFLQAVVS